MPTHADTAWELLQAWGIFDLPSQDEMTFTVAFERKHKTTRGRHELLSSEVREVCIGTRE